MITVGTRAFRKALASALLLAKEEVEKKSNVLDNIYICFDGCTSLYIQATNGYSAIENKINIIKAENCDKFNVIISQENGYKILDLLDIERHSISIQIDNLKFIIDLGKSKFLVDIEDGKYPSFQKNFDLINEFNHTITVDCRLLAELIEALHPAGKAIEIKINSNDNLYAIRFNSDGNLNQRAFLMPMQIT